MTNMTIMTSRQKTGTEKGGDSVNDYWRSFKAKEDDECEDYERRDEDAQTQETENADAGHVE